jgi:hypothetical protein
MTRPENIVRNWDSWVRFTEIRKYTTCSGNVGLGFPSKSRLISSICSSTAGSLGCWQWSRATTAQASSYLYDAATALMVMSQFVTWMADNSLHRVRITSEETLSGKTCPSQKDPLHSRIDHVSLCSWFLTNLESAGICDSELRIAITIICKCIPKTHSPHLDDKSWAVRKKSSKVHTAGFRFGLTCKDYIQMRSYLILWRISYGTVIHKIWQHNSRFVTS